MANRIQEILSVVKKVLSEHTKADIHDGLPVYKDHGGLCESNGYVAERLGGQTWRSLHAFGRPEQQTPQHSLAVIPLTKKRGVVIDISAPKNKRIQGFVNMKTISRDLSTLTGVSDWKKRKVIDAKKVYGIK